MIVMVVIQCSYGTNYGNGSHTSGFRYVFEWKNKHDYP